MESKWTLGPPGSPGPLGAFWGAFGSPGERLGASWGARGRPWEGLGTPWGRLGDPLGPSWGLLGGTGGAFGCLFRVPEVLSFDFWTSFVPFVGVGLGLGLCLAGLSLHPRWILAGFSLDSRWILAGPSLDSSWTVAGSSLDPRWTLAGPSLDPRWIFAGSSLELWSYIGPPRNPLGLPWDPLVSQKPFWTFLGSCCQHPWH